MNCTNFSQNKAFTWLFGSKSNPKAVPHETVQWMDGTTSCNCPGWTRKVQPDGTRDCRHVRLADEGIADDYCVKKIDHTVGKAKPKPIKMPKQVKPEPEIIEPKKTMGVARQIQW